MVPPLDKKIKKLIKDSIRVAPKISNKGELAELRAGLVSPYPQTRKDAIKKTIQQMTLGKDVSSLFPDVLKNIGTNNVEQKKLCYLYVMNYAETHPELCILAVNTFVTDAQDPNPLIRCIAIRTMSMIRVDKILEYIEDPLRRTLKDDNPYVRKTAVICVAKLFQLNKGLCLDLGVLDDLVNALDDENPMVVANTIAALTDIYEMDNGVVDLHSLIQSHVKQFLSVLNECTEWARITILVALAGYDARDALDAQSIIDRVTAHLQHVNPAVVLATIKVIIKNLTVIEPQGNAFRTGKYDVIMNKLSSALVSLMSTPPELQYVALKNIRIVLEKYPEILTKELRVFFVRFNDPLYVKLEKIDILVRLVNPSNLKQCTLLLNELKDYALEFEPEFVSRAIKGLAQLGVKYSDEKFVQKVLDILVELLEKGQDFIKDDCCIAMCNLLRHCTKDSSMGKQVCSILNSWDSPESLLQSDYAKCNYIWLMGQYPQHFSRLQENLQLFIDNFTQETSMTQTSLLLTVIKLHSELPGSMLQNVLDLCTQQSPEVDIRDTAMIYWRCLSMDNSEKLVDDLCKSLLPPIESILEQFSPELLEKLLLQLGTISSVYFKPVDDTKKRKYIAQYGTSGKNFGDLKSLAESELAGAANGDILLDFDASETASTQPETFNSLLDELDDIFDFGNASEESSINATNAQNQSNTRDMQRLKLDDSRDGTTSSHTQDLLDLF